MLDSGYSCGLYTTETEIIIIFSGDICTLKYNHVPYDGGGIYNDKSTINDITTISYIGNTAGRNGNDRWDVP